MELLYEKRDYYIPALSANVEPEEQLTKYGLIKHRVLMND